MGRSPVLLAEQRMKPWPASVHAGDIHLRPITVEPVLSGRVDFATWEVASPRWPPDLDGFEVIQLTDLHLPRGRRWIEPLRDFVGSLRPDLWALTGDLVESRRGLDPLADLLGSLRGRQGVLAVLGNNDYRAASRGEDLRQVFAGLGIRLLLNEPVGEQLACSRLCGREETSSSPTEPRGVWIAGIEDPSSDRDDLSRALDGSLRSDFRILLAHSADIAREAAHAGVDLVLAGHSHGGQICLPWIGPLIGGTKRPRLGRRFAQGPVALGKTFIYVCRGIGTSIIPLRTWCRREITRFIFRSAHVTPPSRQLRIS